MDQPNLKWSGYIDATKIWATKPVGEGGGVGPFLDVVTVIPSLIITALYLLSPIIIIIFNLIIVHVIYIK